MIEKNIFQSWYTKNLPQPVFDKIETFRKLNPEYNYYLYTDEDMDNFVNANYQGEIAECYNRLNIIVAKVDFWRYLVLYKHGGVYVDMDSSIEQPLNKIIQDSDDAIITAEGNPYFFVQWALIFRKGHPILKKCIELVVRNIKNNTYPNDIHKMTGPSVFTEAVIAIHKELFDTTININGITKEINITFEKGDIKYRLFGVNYNDCFLFKYDGADYLYINKKKWTEEAKEKPLLKSQFYVF
jgi:mannosyltransferase OCH1-like enzyme